MVEVCRVAYTNLAGGLLLAHAALERSLVGQFLGSGVVTLGGGLFGGLEHLAGVAPFAADGGGLLLFGLCGSQCVSYEPLSPVAGAAASLVPCCAHPTMPKAKGGESGCQ